MIEELKSEGECLYCGNMFSQREIGKHLAEHLTIMAKESAGMKKESAAMGKKSVVMGKGSAGTGKESTGKRVSNYVHVEVDAGKMFLHLLVKGDAQMKIIDQFLRDIWLECCDHLSAFGHKNFKIAMSYRVEDVFQPRIKIYHDYDFGTTTRVYLKAHKHYQLNLKEKIILLSRNEPLKIMCSMCKEEPAVNICTACWYEEEAFFCEACSEKHAEECEDFNDYAQMPVVNSPRMGVCGYTGGTIDLVRDEPYTR